MSSFQEGKKLFTKGDLPESFRTLHSFLENNDHSTSESDAIESCKMIVKISKLDNLSMSKYINCVSQTYIKFNFFKEAFDLLEIYLGQLEERKYESLYEMIIECSHQLGKIKKEEYYLNQLISLYLRKKSFDQILRIKNIESHFDVMLEVYACTLNIWAVEKLIESNLLTAHYLLVFIEHIKQQTQFWNKSSIVRKWLLNNLDGTKHNRLVTKKFVLKLINDHLVQGEEVNLNQLLAISEHWRLFSLGYFLAKKLGDEKKEDYFLINTPTELMKEEVFDLGGDLLSQISYESNNNKVKDKVRSDNPDINSLIKKIRSFSKQDDWECRDLSLKVFLGSSQEESLKKNYSDIVTNLNMLGEFTHSRKVLDEILYENELSEEQSLDIRYLLIETLMLQKDFFEAERIINNVLITYPLTPKKKIVFLYLKADVLYFQGKQERALELYQQVCEENRNYRLVQHRIIEIQSAK